MKKINIKSMLRDAERIGMCLSSEKVEERVMLHRFYSNTDEHEPVTSLEKAKAVLELIQEMKLVK